MRIWFVILLIGLTKLSLAQDSKAALGFRFGYGWGLSGKYFMDRKGNALEFIARQGVHGVLYNTNYINLGALYEKHKKIDHRGKWLFYYGGGGFFGIGENKFDHAIVSSGIAPVIGLDFWTKNLVVPFNLSFDYKPTFYYDRDVKANSNSFTFTYLDFNISVRVGIGRL